MPVPQQSVQSQWGPTSSGQLSQRIFLIDCDFGTFSGFRVTINNSCPGGLLWLMALLKAVRCTSFTFFLRQYVSLTDNHICKEYRLVCSRCCTAEIMVQHLSEMKHCCWIRPRRKHLRAQSFNNSWRAQLELSGDDFFRSGLRFHSKHIPDTAVYHHSCTLSGQRSSHVCLWTQQEEVFPPPSPP